MQTPFDEREVTVLLSGLLLAASTLYFRSDIKRVPGWRLLLAGVGCMVVGNAATVIEHALAYQLFNIIEHASYMLQSVVLAAWALRLRSGAR